MRAGRFVLGWSVLGILGFTLGCTSNGVKEKEVPKKIDVIRYLNDLDSAGIDIENDSVLFQYGYQAIYFGKDEAGNALIDYAFSRMDSVTADDYRHWSVQNTKNGNYAKAIELLEKAMELNPQETSRYYGWVLLYYYRDYHKALSILNLHDDYTPNFDDAPMGEDIHYLKGLCYMQLLDYNKALSEFDRYITHTTESHGEKFVNVYTFVQKGRCLEIVGKPKKAIQAFEKAIELYDKCSEAYYFMGLAQLKMGEKELACENFNTALQLVNKGYKSEDNYVEYFHEIYAPQIKQSIQLNCTH